ncbi:extracellular solute-binding protein [Candidatus Poribacteria bacterium]|nr:extracellular solute-binding protein [Candidatus Poribacteria bacterium]
MRNLRMRRALWVGSLLAVVALALSPVGCKRDKAKAPQAPVVLKMTGPDWGPTKLMADISKDFTAYATETLGHPVQIDFEGIPWSSYYERLAAALAAGDPAYDLFVSDSQWIGAFAASGYIVELNPYMDQDPALKAILDGMDPALRAAYCAYPEGSQTYYGFPQEADVKGFMIRKDLFSHEGERQAFRKKYGYDLPQTYEEFDDADWVQVRDFAEFFTRKAGQTLAGEKLANDFFGIALPYSKSYDFLSMGWYLTLYNWGGDIWDWDTHKVSGVLNSPAAVESLTFYRDLLKFQPPGATNYDFDGINNAVAQGVVAMAINWIAVCPPLFDATTSKVADKLMVAVPPGHKGKDGVARRAFNLGGQPFVVGSKTQHMDDVLAYIKWWFQEEQQRRFAQGGGLPSVTAIVSSEEFRSQSPWTRAFSDSIPYQRDVWKNPSFFEMLTVQQEELHAVISGDKDPKTALDTVAQKQDEILQRASGAH